MTQRKVKSFCRICGSSCGIVVEIEGERVLRVRGDRNHPLTAGYTCSKGRALAAAHHSPDRLLGPQVRRDGELRASNWDETLDDLADRLRGLIAESGPESIGFFLGNSGYTDSAALVVRYRFPRVLGTPQFYSDLTIDAVAKVLVSELMAGAVVFNQPDLKRCKLFLLVGTNPLVSHGHTAMLANPTQSLREMTANGEVWVLDPRRTETAAKATRHLAARPGSDYAILGYVIRELLRDGADRAFLEQHAQDVDRLAHAVEPYDLETSASLSGLPPAELQDLFAAVRNAGRLSVDVGTGVTMSRAGNVTQWLSVALMAVTGSLDRKGGAWFNPGFHTQLDRQKLRLVPPEGRRLPGPKSRPDLRAVGGEYPCSAMASEIEAGHLRALINLGGNLVTCMPDTDRTVAALQALDVLATIEVAAGQTTAISTHVLAAKDQLERPDIGLVQDTGLPEIATSYTSAAVEAVGEARSAWWILLQIGNRLGLDFLPGIDPDTASDDDVIAFITSGSRLDHPVVSRSSYTVAGPPTFGWVNALVDTLGGWRLAPQEFVDQLAGLRVPAGDFILISRRRHHNMNSRLMEGWDRPGILLNAGDARRCGLAEGSPAVVRSAHGEVEGLVQIDPTLSRGVINVPHGFSPTNVNQLTSSADSDPLSGMAIFSGLPVTVQPVPETVTS